MNKVTSKDGTVIAYDKRGSGPAVILVDGALCYRSFGPMAHLAELLSPQFTVYCYDRRGRGDSSNHLPYTLDREIEDIDALINEAGGSAYLFGTSSGGSLALEASGKLGAKVGKLAFYEAPYNISNGAGQAWKNYRKELNELLAADKRGDAAALFMTFVGTPAGAIAGMRQAPVWPMFEAVAPTLAYDAATLGEDRSVPVRKAANVTAPTLVMSGNITPFMLDSAKILAKAIPHAQLRTLEGQTHDVNLEVLAPVLVVFFTG
jgi:pimeloyl-ACP methyl ester carboxylesterase